MAPRANHPSTSKVAPREPDLSPAAEAAVDRELHVILGEYELTCPVCPDSTRPFNEAEPRARCGCGRHMTLMPKDAG